MKSKLVISIGLIIILSIAGYLGALYLSLPVNKNDTSTKVIVINRGESFNSIASKLAAQNLIRTPLALRLAAYQAEQGKNIQAGSFKLSPSMSTTEIMDTLAHGKLDVWVTILEGWRLEEIADGIAKVFAENKLAFDKDIFLAQAKGKEGYLFPDSYLFPINTSEATIISVLESTLTKKITPDFKTAIAASGKNLHQILTMASIVEREARTSDSRKKVAGILWKRVDSGWPLQADATLQYAKGFDKIENTWWKPPLAADKDLKSAYNTYKNIGLPPGPICAPSLSSIEAAIYPQASTAWYYITDNQGVMRYAVTLEQHNQNVDTYLR